MKEAVNFLTQVFLRQRGRYSEHKGCGSGRRQSDNREVPTNRT